MNNLWAYEQTVARNLNLSLVSIAYNFFTATELPTTDESFNGEFILCLKSYL